jgi:RNA polymerase sigma-70 factor (ECF subfamily)
MREAPARRRDTLTASRPRSKRAGRPDRDSRARAESRLWRAVSPRARGAKFALGGGRFGPSSTSSRGTRRHHPLAATIPAVYRRLLAPIRAKSRRMLGDSQAAEDVAQEAFVRLLQSRSELAADADERALVAWIYRTTTRLALDALRDRRRTAPTEDLDAIPCGVGLDAALGAKAAIQVLGDTTPAEELEAAVFCRIDGLSQPEAAAVLGVSERTVRRLLGRFDERTAAMRKEHAQ